MFSSSSYFELLRGQFKKMEDFNPKLKQGLKTNDQIFVLNQHNSIKVPAVEKETIFKITLLQSLPSGRRNESGVRSFPPRTTIETKTMFSLSSCLLQLARTTHTERESRYLKTSQTGSQMDSVMMRRNQGWEKYEY